MGLYAELSNAAALLGLWASVGILWWDSKNRRVEWVLIRLIV